MKKIPPPPPGWKRKPVPGESDLLAQWEPYVRKLARGGVFYGHRLALDDEAVAQELRDAASRAYRKFVHKHRAAPSDALMKSVLVRRLHVLRRDAKAAYRVQIYNDHMPVDPASGEQMDVDQLADDQPSVLERIDEGERAALHGMLVYGLRRNLPKAVFAVLQLRLGEELTGAQIAEMAGLRDWEQISGKVYHAKERARAFLSSLGFDDWQSVSSELGVEDVDYDDIE